MDDVIYVEGVLKINSFSGKIVVYLRKINWKLKRWKNYEKRENQVYMFSTCFNMFLYSFNNEFYE